jgi:hypothetical protein
MLGSKCRAFVSGYDRGISSHYMLAQLLAELQQVQHLHVVLPEQAANHMA